MILEKYDAKLIEFDRTRKYEQSTHVKPRGLWVSVKGEDDWVAWNESAQFIDTTCQVRHTVTLRASANILFLETAEAIRAFHMLYSVKPEYRFDAKINWPRVVSDYDGIIIAPYQWSIRMDDELFWYYGWDCASGCIWNLDAIEDVVPIW